MLLPDETYDHGALAAGHLLSMLRVYDEFLVKYRIRPEFFCRYKEKEALQKRLSKVVEETNKRNAQSTQDASSSNEAVHLQQRLRSLSSELVTLRNRLHVQGSPPAPVTTATSTPTSTTPAPTPAATNSNPPPAQVTNSSCNNNNNNQQLKGNSCNPAQSNTNIAIGLDGKGAANTPAGGIPTSGSNNASLSTKANCKGEVSTVDGAVKCGVIVGINGDKDSGGGGKGLSCQQQMQQVHHNAISVLLPQCSIKNIAKAALPMLPPPDSNGTTTCADTNNPYIIHGLGSLDNGTDTLYQRTPLPGANLEDLIHMAGPLTEDAVMRCLHGRFAAGNYYTNVGPILLCVNPYKDVGNPLTLSSTRGLVLSKQLNKIVKETVRQQSETGYPQAIILSGTSGSGKSHASMLLLRELFAVAGGGPETDAFKHLAAAFTVLRSLGSAKTSTNSESSRIGQFIEVQVTDGALYRTKIHCYFLDQTRVIHPLPSEKNYHIFYQMLAGLSTDERAKLNLDGCTPSTLKYLQHGDVKQDLSEDSTRFQAWKACLGILGIPFLDVVRVLAAVLLLGNIQFVDGKSLKVDVKGETELNAVAGLLGVSGSALFRGLTARTHNARGQLVKSMCDANISNMTRDSLAKALYCRTVATIVRRANSLKRLGSTLGTLSSDSNESVHNHHQAEVASQHASTAGGTTNAGSKSMAALNNAVRHATDGFIGILDMFGFEDPKPSQLEHLCINLCAETMQHFYNTHIFKSSIESCRDEGINCEVEVDYVDNVPCIDLISSLRTGLLSMLDVECSIRGTAESYVAKIRVQHKHNTRLFDPKPLEQRLFGIQHFSGRVVYDASDFLDTNKDVVPDDLVAVFYKHSCNFGFATHLFGSELKALYSVQDVPRGVSFRISPTSHTDLLNGDEPVSTLTQDFHTRLDNLLRTLVHARPHFVRCIRSNSNESGNKFDRGTVVRQIRSLQILETVNLMAGGYPHRMRFKAFNARYRLLAPFARLQRKDDSVTDDCHLILQHVVDAIAKDFTASTSWALGKRHIFLSEGIRQHLEQLRNDTRQRSATLIQATWRGWKCRFRWANMRKEKSSSVKASAGAINRNSSGTRPRPQPIAGTPPPDPNEKCDSKVIQQTCNLFGLDLERPPPVPPSRSYTVTGNTKLSYPQTRLMKMSFPEDGSGEAPVLVKGESVLVVGASHRRGHLIVEHKQCTLHVPFQFLELKPGANI